MLEQIGKIVAALGIGSGFTLAHWLVREQSLLFAWLAYSIAVLLIYLYVTRKRR